MALKHLSACSPELRPLIEAATPHKEIAQEHALNRFAWSKALPAWLVDKRAVSIGVLVTMMAVLALVLHRPLPDRERPTGAQIKAIGVMHFEALSVDPQLEWMRDAIRDNFNSQLSSASDRKVYSKEHIDFVVRKTGSPEIEVANQLGIEKMISGSFLATTNKLRIEAHVVDVQSGFLEASDHVEGEQSDFFDLQRQLAAKIIAHLNIASPSGEKAAVPSIPEPPSLDRYKTLLEADGETGAAEPAKGDDPRSQRAPRRKDDKHSRTLPWWEWPKASTTWADETPQQGLASEEEIRQVLEMYRQAYEKKDLALLDNVFDTVTTAQREAITKYFQYTQDLRVTIRDVDIAVWGDEAAVSCTREDQFVDTQTGRTVKLNTRFTKIFMRTDGAWKIVGKRE
jgi:TolB-like protein/ketosteroid isomerase-like protein